MVICQISSTQKFSQLRFESEPYESESMKLSFKDMLAKLPALDSVDMSQGWSISVLTETPNFVIKNADGSYTHAQTGELIPKI